MSHTTTSTTSQLDSRATSTSPWKAATQWMARHHLPLFRVTFGLYFVVLFARMLPWATSMYSNGGVLADWRLNPTSDMVPNLLYIFDSPTAAVACVVAMLLLSISYLVGFRLKWVAVLMWAGWAMLWHRNVLTLNPSMPFNGFLMLATLFFPANMPWSVDRWLALRRSSNRTTLCQDTPPPREPTGHVPRDLWRVVWVVTAVAYTFSGWTKLTSPGWFSGDALRFILDGPLARDVVWVDWMLSGPSWLLPILTWLTLGAELLYGPLALLGGHKGRLLAWTSMVALHVGLVGVLQFAELSVGMLLVHVLTFDPRWLRLWTFETHDSHVSEP